MPVFFKLLDRLSSLIPKGLLGASSGSVIGLDIGSSSIKVVQIRKKGGRPILETYGELSLGPYAGVSVGQATNLSEEKLSEAIKDLFREANVTSRSAAIALPLSSSLISLITLPKLSEDRMAEMIPLEARRYIPVPIPEVLLDWWILPEEERGAIADRETSAPTRDVLLVAILKDAASRYERIASLSGMPSPTFEMEIFSTVRSTVMEGIEPIMVLDVGAGSSKVYLVHKGIVRDAHTLNKGSQDVTLAISTSGNVSLERAEELKRSGSLGPTASPAPTSGSLVMESILSEANRVLLSFEKRFHKTISKVILTGGGAALMGFADMAKQRLPAQVEMANPFQKLLAPAFLEDVLKRVGPEFSVAVGAALRRLSDVD